MVTRKSAKKATGKLKLKKDTIKDLSPRGKVKGGARVLTSLCQVRPGTGGTTIMPGPGPVGGANTALCGG